MNASINTLVDPAKRHNGLYPVTLAVADYDRTRPLIDGRVKPDGIALTTNTSWIGDFCVRPVYEEYDTAEMSLSWYVMARTRGEPVVALPVFPLRMPVFAYVFVREDSPYTKPSDLVGKRVASILYRITSVAPRHIRRVLRPQAPRVGMGRHCRRRGRGVPDSEWRTPDQRYERHA